MTSYDHYLIRETQDYFKHIPNQAGLSKTVFPAELQRVPSGDPVHVVPGAVR
jgi:hypothetical protein